MPAALRLVGDRPVVEMPTSTGTLRRMERVGVLEFTLKGQPLTLARFRRGRHARIETLFVPFADRDDAARKRTRPGVTWTSHPTPTGIYAIDFNKAYNPYCAYNDDVRVSVPAAVESVEARRFARAVRKATEGMMSRPLQAIVFDFDGVIANSEPLHLAAFQQALADDGVELSATTTTRGISATTTWGCSRHWGGIAGCR